MTDENFNTLRSHVGSIYYENRIEIVGFESELRPLARTWGLYLKIFGYAERFLSVTERLRPAIEVPRAPGGFAGRCGEICVAKSDSRSHESVRVSLSL